MGSAEMGYHVMDRVMGGVARITGGVGIRMSIVGRHMGVSRSGGSVWQRLGERDSRM